MSVIGAIFPIPSRLLDRIFKEGRNVFLKPPTIYRELREGSKILFYASGELREIVGEGTAERLELLRPDEAVRKYGGKLFLDPEEVSDYLRGKRRASKVLVIVLKDLRRYKKGYKPKRFVTVAGKKLTEAEYREIVRVAEGGIT
ncbi:MAG: DUF365 domain-containing protein [Candidatus Korarchaeum sp.]